MGCTVSTRNQNSKEPHHSLQEPLSFLSKINSQEQKNQNSHPLSDRVTYDEPVSSPLKKNLRLSHHRSLSNNLLPKERHLIPGLSITMVYHSEDDSASTLANSPKENALQLTRRSSYGSQSFLSKPSTFLREKVFSEEANSIQSNLDRAESKEELGTRRTSLGGHLVPHFHWKEPGKAHKVQSARKKSLMKNGNEHFELGQKTPAFKQRLSLQASTYNLGFMEGSPSELSTHLPKLHSPTFRQLIGGSQLAKNGEVMSAVVKEEVEAEERENDDKQKSQSLQEENDHEKKQEKEEIKKHIEKNFTVNLIDLIVLKKSSTEIPKSREISSPKDLKSSPKGIRLPPIQSPRQPFPGLKIPLREDNDMEETKEMPSNSKTMFFGSQSSTDSNGETSARNQTPTSCIKKSLFSTFSEHVTEMNYGGGGATTISRGNHRRLSRFGLAFKGLAHSQERDVNAPSLLFTDSKYQGNDSIGSSVIETRALDKSIDEEGQKRINQYILSKELGRGSFGRVKLCMHNKTGERFAIKIANKEKLQKKMLNKDKSVYTQLESEIAVMKKLNHPNIVKLHEVIDDPNAEKLYLVMDYIERGAVMSDNYWAAETQGSFGTLIRASSESPINFRRYMKRGMTVAGTRGSEINIPSFNENRHLTEEKAKKYFRDLILGLDYLHNYAHIIHRDIKPENLLIDRNDTLKISDFNISHIMEESSDKKMLKNAAGTKAYLAPEVWIGGGFRGKPLDVWAAGATLYYFLYGKGPFISGNQNHLKQLVLNAEPEFPEDAFVSPEAIELIKACLIKNPDERITIEEIKNNKWLTDDGSILLDNKDMPSLVINEDDLRRALTNRLQTTFMIAIGMQRNLKVARLSLKSRQQTQSQIGSLTSVTSEKKG